MQRRDPTSEIDGEGWSDAGMETTWACARDIVHVGVDLWLATATGGRAAPQELAGIRGKSRTILVCMLGVTLPCRKWTSRKVCWSK